MLSEWHGGFFFFFASTIVVMGLAVFFLVPETKGRTLEGMDEVFGSAYPDGLVTEMEHGAELEDYRIQRGVRNKGVVGGDDIPDVSTGNRGGLPEVTVEE
jgi:hypothetical protein